MAALQSNIPDRQLFESSLPVAERVLALVLECLLEPLPLGPCISGLGWVAGLTKNRATSAFQFKLELGLRLSLAKPKTSNF